MSKTKRYEILMLASLQVSKTFSIDAVDEDDAREIAENEAKEELLSLDLKLDWTNDDQDNIEIDTVEGPEEDEPDED